MSTERFACIEILREGGIAVLKTDTLYGIVARSDDEQAVKRVRAVKKRSPDKSLIVMLAQAEDAYNGAEILQAYSDGIHPTSIIVPSPHAPAWLRHQDGTVAYRIPVDTQLQELLSQTGPLVAPSANPEGLPVALTIDEARMYFHDMVDYYLDGGVVEPDIAPSRLIRVSPRGDVTQLR